MTEPRRIDGAKYLGPIEPGERWAVLWGGGIVVTHPDRPPVLIDHDGVRREIVPSHGPARERFVAKMRANNVLLNEDAAALATLRANQTIVASYEYADTGGCTPPGPDTHGLQRPRSLTDASPLSRPGVGMGKPEQPGKIIQVIAGTRSEGDDSDGA